LRNKSTSTVSTITPRIVWAYVLACACACACVWWYIYSLSFPYRNRKAHENLGGERSVRFLSHTHTRTHAHRRTCGRRCE